jgi:single-strand DNA-binding protein
MLNRIILIGRIGSEIEKKYTPSGVAVTQFRLAVNRPISAEAKQRGDEKQVDWIQIVTWRQSADFAAQYLFKGQLVALEGRLQIREYVNAEGQKRRDAEVVADNIRPLQWREDGTGSAPTGGGEGSYAPPPGQSNGGGNQARSGGNRYSPPSATNDDDDDDPFSS